MLPCPTSWRSFLILSSFLHLILPGVFFLPLKPYIHLSSPHAGYMTLLSHSSVFVHPNNFWWAVQIIKLLITQFSLLPCYLIPLRTEYSPQYPILKHPQPSVLSQFERSSFTTIKNNRQNYSSVYFKFFFLNSGFGALGIACWPLVCTFAGSNPAETVGFLGRKNPQHAFLRRGSKAVGPIS